MAEERQGKGGGAGDLAGAGIQFGAAIVVFTLLGVWLDRRFDTSPVFVLLGAALGAGGGFYSMYRRLIKTKSPPPPKP